MAEPPTVQLALKSQAIFTVLADEEIEELARVSQHPQAWKKSNAIFGE